MELPYVRQINFDSIHNFRDLGGYCTCDGHQMTWHKLFRSGELHHMTNRDIKKIKNEIRLKSILDLRSSFEIKQQGLGLIQESGFKYYNISLISDGGDKQANQKRYKGLTNMGEFYLKLTGQEEFSQRIIEALEIIADPSNYPLVFHCSSGKDRTGILAAVVLGILDINDEDITADYCLSASYTQSLYESQKVKEDNGLPDYFWKVTPELIMMFLIKVKEEYGSMEQYVKAKGADLSLIQGMRRNLLS